MRKGPGCVFDKWNISSVHCKRCTEYTFYYLCINIPVFGMFVKIFPRYNRNIVDIGVNYHNPISTILNVLNENSMRIPTNFLSNSINSVIKNIFLLTNYFCCFQLQVKQTLLLSPVEYNISPLFESSIFKFQTFKINLEWRNVVIQWQQKEHLYIYYSTVYIFLPQFWKRNDYTNKTYMKIPFNTILYPILKMIKTHLYLTTNTSAQQILWVML